MEGGRRPGPRRAATLVWLVVWTGFVLAAAVMLVRAALEGEFAVAGFFVLWLAGALWGLFRVGRDLAEDVTGERLGPERRRRAPRRWRGDLPRGDG